MKHLLELEDKLTKMTPMELHEYATENYPEVPDIGFGKKKLVIRKVLNSERERMNKEENQSTTHD